MQPEALAIMGRCDGAMRGDESKDKLLTEAVDMVVVGDDYTGAAGLTKYRHASVRETKRLDCSAWREAVNSMRWSSTMVIERTGWV